jgi:glycosyltransferase involved in cell wall biosynthesis
MATSERNVVGGAEKYLQVVIPGLLKRGHDVALLYENPSNEALETVDPPTAVPAWCTRKNASIMEALRSVAEWKPDIAYVHRTDSPELEDALLENYRTVYYAHNYTGTCMTGSKSFAFPQRRPCDRKIGLPCIFLHYPRRCGGVNPMRILPAYKRQTQFHDRLNDFGSVLVASTHMRHAYSKNGVSSNKLVLLPYPATGNPPLPAAPVRKVPSGRILFFGRLTRVKGVDYLIEALSKASGLLGSSLTLTVAGDGPEKSKLELLARRLKVNATFTGWVQDKQIRQFAAENDVVGVPSVWPEPFGLVGIEAGGLGLPAVGYAVGGIPDWLLPGETGELAPGDPPTVSGLSDAIVRTLESPDHYNKLRLGAWNMAANFGLDLHLDRLEPILAGVLPADGSRLSVL